MYILTDQEIEVAVRLLQEGEIVAFPTETVYGLGAAIFNPSAIEKIYRAKNRPADNPLIAHIADFCQADRIAHSLPREFFLLAEHFWPGPLTMLAFKQPEVPHLASAGLSTIGLRMPSHPLALRLIEAVGEPLVAPSANLSGKPSATCVSHVLQDFQGKIAAVIDGGDCRVGLESTVLDLTDPAGPIILRPGMITPEDLESIIGQEVRLYSVLEEKEKPRSPGMKYRHYAPEAIVSLYTDRKELERQWEQKPETCCVLAPSGTALRCPYLPLLPHTLYAELRAADQKGYRRILIFCDGEVLKNTALMNRLLKAAS